MSTVQASEASMRQRWGVPRFGYAANRIMLWVGVKALWVGYALVWVAALYFFLCVPKARRASADYLWRVRGQAKQGALRRDWETYRHLVEFGYLLLDRALMLARPTHGFAMTCEGLEHFRAGLAQGRGLIMLTAHFGNAEAAAPYMKRVGLNRPMHLVMYQDAKDATERFHSEHRKMLAGMDVITTMDPLGAGVKIMKALKDGDAVAMRADRAMDGRAVDATLLGAPVGLPAGPFVAAALSGAPVVSVYTCRLGWRKYACVISKVANYGDETGGTREERTERAARDYAAFLEGMLRKHPRQWTNFYAFWSGQGKG